MLTSPQGIDRKLPYAKIKILSFDFITLHIHMYVVRCCIHTHRLKDICACGSLSFLSQRGVVFINFACFRITYVSLMPHIHLYILCVWCLWRSGSFPITTFSEAILIEVLFNLSFLILFLIMYVHIIHTRLWQTLINMNKKDVKLFYWKISKNWNQIL